MTSISATPDHELIKALIDAHRQGLRADARQFPVPDYARALEIQRQVQTTLGPVGGFKVARRAEGAPVIAPISANRILPSCSDVQIDSRMGIELEIGFELVSHTVPNNVDDLCHHFRPCIALELVDTRLDGAGDIPMMKLADMQINAGLIVGPTLANWNGEDFGTVEASLRCGEQLVIDGATTVPGGSACTMLSLLLEHVGKHCGGLRQGHIVITGSLSGLHYFSAGTDVLGSIPGFGEVSCYLL